MYSALNRQYRVLKNMSYMNFVMGLFTVVLSFGMVGVGKGLVLVAGVAFLLTGWQMKQISQSVQETSLKILRGEVQMMLYRSLMLEEDLPDEVLKGLPCALVTYRTLKESELESIIGRSHREDLEIAKASLERFYVKELGLYKRRPEIEA